MCVCVCVCLHWETKSQKIIHDMILSEITFSPQPSPVPRKVETVSYSVVSNSLQLHGLLYARILEWVAIPFSRGSSRPRDQTEVSCFALRTIFPGDPWATWEADKDAYVILQYHYSPQNSWRMKNGFLW